MEKFKPTGKLNGHLYTHFPRYSRCSHFSIFARSDVSLLSEVLAEITCPPRTSPRTPAACPQRKDSPASVAPALLTESKFPNCPTMSFVV